VNFLIGFLLVLSCLSIVHGSPTIDKITQKNCSQREEELFYSNLKLFTSESSVASHPEATVEVPVGYKILGGGAFAHGDPSKGSLLTECFPLDLQHWRVKSKDQIYPDPSSITGYALALYDPEDKYDVKIFNDTSAVAAHPSISVTVEEGYVLTGGGACSHCDYRKGNLLTATYPSSVSTWTAAAKDHFIPDPASLTVYAIGIKAASTSYEVNNKIVSATSERAAHPATQVTAVDRYEKKEGRIIVTGGGALVNYTEPGNLLTATYPTNSGWYAGSKDQDGPSPCDITVYAITLNIVE